MPKPKPAASKVHLDEDLLKRLGVRAHTSGQQLFNRIKRELAQGNTEAAVTLFMLALFVNVGTTLTRFDDPSVIPPQVNALWRLMGVPMCMELQRVQ